MMVTIVYVYCRNKIGVNVNEKVYHSASELVYQLLLKKFTTLVQI